MEVWPSAHRPLETDGLFSTPKPIGPALGSHPLLENQALCSCPELGLGRVGGGGRVVSDIRSKPGAAGEGK